MLQASLRVLSERQNGTVIPLPKGRFLIGREEDCQLRPNSELISRHHCVFTNDDITIRVRDLGSTNGTFVNGERLKGSVVLNAGDRVAVGKLEFEIAIGDEVPSDSGSQPLPDADVVNDDTQYAASANAETHTEIPAYSQPPVGTGDTAMFPPQQPGAYPGAPGYMPPFPQQGYPYPGYPPMYPGYYMPNMPYPGMPGYPQQAPGAAPAAAPPAEDSGFPEIRLPDPETTGVKPPAPPPPAAEGASAEGDKAAPKNVPATAENIIKQYLHRRPAGGK